MITSLRDASSAYLNIFRATDDFPVERLDAEHHEILEAHRSRPGQGLGRDPRPPQGTVERVSSRLEQPHRVSVLVQVHALALRPEDPDELDRAVDRAEPVRGPGAELDGLAGGDLQVALAEQES